jgi:hypothetical protein
MYRSIPFHHRREFAIPRGVVSIPALGYLDPLFAILGQIVCLSVAGKSIFAEPCAAHRLSVRCPSEEVSKGRGLGRNVKSCTKKLKALS